MGDTAGKRINVNRCREQRRSLVRVVTGMLLMLRSEDCRVFRMSEFWGDVKNRITSCLLCNTARSCVGRKNHSLTEERTVKLMKPPDLHKPGTSMCCVIEKLRLGVKIQKGQYPKQMLQCVSRTDIFILFTFPLVKGTP